MVFIDLYGTLVEMASSDGTPQVDPRVRGRLHQMTGPFGAVAILTGWSVAQVSGLGLAVPGCHILGQLGAEHWGPGVGEESILTSLMPIPLGLSMAEATLRAAVEEHGMAAEAIHRKSHSLAYRFAEGSDPEAVGRVVFQLRKTTEDAGDLTLLEDRSVVKLLPKGLDKRKALRRFLSGFVPWKPSVIVNVGDAPDRVLMEELDRMRRDEGRPTLKVGIAESLPGEVDLAIPGPPEGPLMLMDAMCGSARTR